MPASCRRTSEHPAGFTLRVFDHDEANARLRKRGSGENLHCLCRIRSEKWLHPRPDFFDDTE